MRLIKKYKNDTSAYMIGTKNINIIYIELLYGNKLENLGEMDEILKDSFTKTI